MSNDLVMKQLSKHNRRIIWSTCSACVLIVTLVIAYFYGIYGIWSLLPVLLVFESLLQLYKIVYQKVALCGKFDLKLAIRITNCWTIYLILNMALITGGLFTFLIMLAETEIICIPKSLWLIIVVSLACVISLKPIQPFIRKEKYSGESRSQAKLITAFASRFVILYSFIVYYFIAFVESTEWNLFPTVFIVYLGVDRLIAMFNTIIDYESQEYYSLFRDTVKWMKKYRVLSSTR